MCTLDSLIPSEGVCHHCVILTCPLWAEAVTRWHTTAVIFREKIERRRSGGGVGAGRCEEGEGKEPELPDLNKVNFPAIWPVFGGKP